MDQKLDTQPDEAKMPFGRFSRRLASVSVLLVGLGITVIECRLEWRRDLDKIAIENTHTAEHVRDEFETRLIAYRHMMLSGMALIRSSNYVSRDEWRELTNTIELAERFPEVFGLALIEIVPEHTLESWLEAQRNSGVPDFQLKSPIDAAAHPPRSDHFVIKYHEPAEVNRMAWGLDVSRLNRNREPYIDSLESGSLRMTPGLRLVQAELESTGVLLALPIKLENIPEHHARPGWIAIAVAIDRCFEAIRLDEWASIRIRITEPGNATHPVLYDSMASPGLEESLDGFGATADLEFGGRRWVIRVTPSTLAAAMPDQAKSIVIIIIGSTLSVMLSLLVWSISRTRDRAEAIAIEQTRSLRESESRLQLLVQQAEAANRTKTEFLANMSHEIRTPMTAILGFTELLGKSIKPECNANDALETIRRNGEHLLQIINDVLNISKIESGLLAITQKDVELESMVKDIYTLLSKKAASKGLQLLFEAQAGAETLIQTDPVRLRQIMLNLIGNAIKFTEHGSVLVRVSGGAPLGRSTIEVIDSGIGLDPKLMDKLFDPFTQGDSTHTRNYGGTGLGLAISKQLAEVLGGTLTADSSSHIGSRFILTLENKAPKPETISISPNKSDEAPHQNTVVSARVLIAEDCPDNQRLIAHHLSQSGHEVTTADDGVQAVDLAIRANEAGEPFDLILMDMQMPKLDGYGAATRLRTMGYTGRIVALTAHAMEHDKRRCLEAGCDEYATKPIPRDELLRLVQNSHRAA